MDERTGCTVSGSSYDKLALSAWLSERNFGNPPIKIFGDTYRSELVLYSFAVVCALKIRGWGRVTRAALSGANSIGAGG